MSLFNLPIYLFKKIYSRRKVILLMLLVLLVVDTGSTVAGTREAKQRSVAQGASPNEIRIRIPAEPASLNPIDGANWSAGEVHNYVLESLLLQDPETLAWRGRLAESWERSPDDRTYTFHLRPGLVWSDGEPLTADDVKFSFDAIFDDRFAAAQVRPFYQGIEGVEVVDARTVRFKTRASYFGNFISCAQMNIVPRHIYQNPEDSVRLQTRVVGSGPYVFDVWQSGRMIRLKRNPRWWGWEAKVPESVGRPDRLGLYFVSDDNVAIEMMRKGELDYTSLTSDEYRILDAEKGLGFEVVRVQNLVPKAVKSLAFNLDRPLFQNVELRRALSLVIDREMIAERFFHGLMKPAKGPWYSQSPFADPSVQPDPHDPVAAFEILNQHGWRDSDGDFILDRENDAGQKEQLKFAVLVTNAEDLRYMTVVKQDARQIGIDIDLRQVSEVVFNEAMRHGRFDAAIVSRGASWIEFDPSVSWNSKSLPSGGYNFGRFQDDESDHLIAQALAEPSFENRVPIMRALYRRIVGLAPEIFLFNENESFYAVQKRIERDRPTYAYDIGLPYWRVRGAER